MAKRFERIEAGKKIGGVCTGLADYFNLDVTLVRVLFVVLVLASVGSAALAYLILWAVAPVAPQPGATGPQPPH
jgi:phage shock protein PspC (stress-responsive transcriptional regulator)